MNDVSTIPVEELPKRAAIADKRLERSRNQIILVGLVLLIFAFATAGLSVNALNQAEADNSTQQKISNDQQTANGAKIDALTAQLASAQAQIAQDQAGLVKNQADVLATLDRQNAKTACEKVFQTRTDATFQDEFSAIARVVVSGFSTAPAPSPDRAAALDKALNDLAATVATHDVAAADQAAYIKAGSLLPCPVTG